MPKSLQNGLLRRLGRLLGWFWAQTAIGLLHFEPFWAAPGGFREASGGLLGRLWLLLARLWALPGSFLGVSGALSGMAGQEA